MASSNEPEWTDEDFIARDQPDPIETLRQYIRQRLRQGATQPELEDELTRQGLDSTYVAELIRSVGTTGRYGELEVGTELFVNGVSAGFFMNPIFEKKRRLARRQQRQGSESDPPPREPNAALAFGDAMTAERELARDRSRRRRRLLMVGGVVALAALAVTAYLLFG